MPKEQKTYFFIKVHLSRNIQIKEFYKFQETKKPSSKLKNLMKITNQKRKRTTQNIIFKKIDVPLRKSSKLMNSKIGEYF